MPSKPRVLTSAALFGLAISSVAPGQTANGGVIDRAQQQVVAFFAKMADLTCTETVTQQKFRPDGHVGSTQQHRFDYLIMVQASRDDLSLNESRIEAGASPPARLPMLVTNGFSMLLLVFDPYYSASFRFRPAPEERPQGQGPIPIHFTHIHGARSPAALSLRGREYPLELDGTAWVDPLSGAVERIDANLANNMSDLGLRSLQIQVEYRATTLHSTHGMELPARAVIDLQTARQHWRNTHVFSDYKSFSTSAQQETTVKVIEGPPGTKAAPPPQKNAPHQEER